MNINYVPMVVLFICFIKEFFEGSQNEFEQDCYFHVLSGKEYEEKVRKENKQTSQTPGDDDAAFQLVGALDSLNELVDIQKELKKDLAKKEQEQKKAGNGNRKLSFMDKPINTWTVDMVGTWLDSVEFHHYKEGMHWMLKLLQSDPGNHSVLVLTRHCLHAIGQQVKYQFKSSSHTAPAPQETATRKFKTRSCSPFPSSLSYSPLSLSPSRSRSHSYPLSSWP